MSVMMREKRDERRQRQAEGARALEESGVLDELYEQIDAGSQYTSLAFTTQLVDAGITGSIETVGDAYDNALMESTIGLYKTEVIELESARWEDWRHVEIATAQWVAWYNNECLHSGCGDIPPTEYETMYYDQTHQTATPVAS